jgi:hypothetical protein
MNDEIIMLYTQTNRTEQYHTKHLEIYTEQQPL